MNRWLIALVVFVGLTTLFSEIYVTEKALSVRTDLCHIITASRSQVRADLDFQTGIYNRAIIRAKVEKGTLRQADIDAAATAKRKIAADEAGLKFQFPGC